MGNNLQKYHDYTVEDAERQAAEAAATRGAIRKLEQGDNVLRVLPSRAGEEVFKVVHEHWVEVAGMSGSFVCPYMMAKQSCTICQEMRRLKASPNPLDRTRGDDMYARKRVYVNAINRGDEEPVPAVHVLPGKVLEDIQAIRRKFPGASGNITNPETGYDLIITRTGTGKKDTRYRVDIAREQTPLADDQDLYDEWIANQADLNRFARLPDEQEVATALEGGAEAPAEERPRARVTTTAPAGRSQASSGRPSGRPGSAGGSTASAGRGAAGRGRRAEDGAVDAEYTHEDES